jgi:hypothetical protein
MGAAERVAIATGSDEAIFGGLHGFGLAACGVRDHATVEPRRRFLREFASAVRPPRFRGVPTDGAPGVRQFAPGRGAVTGSLVGAAGATLGAPSATQGVVPRSVRPRVGSGKSSQRVARGGLPAYVQQLHATARAVIN